MYFPFSTSSTTAAGAAAGSPIAVGGIRANDVLLALIRWKLGAEAEPVVMTSFTPTTDAIESASVDTSDYTLVVIWRTPAVLE